MKTIRLLFLSLTFICMTSACTSINAREATIKETQPSHAQLKKEATDFLNVYLNAYNKRFGHPERKESFMAELTGLLNDPFILAPPKNKPFSPDNLTGFERFVQGLEKKGAVKLRWEEMNLHVLTEKKILANNVGFGIDAGGKVVYETVSVYLLYRTDNGWKIVLFSPYDMQNKLTF